MKAILVIDMPKDCAECQFCGYGGRNLEKYVCCLTKEHSEGPHLVGCPLKPMPQKKDFFEEYMKVDRSMCKQKFDKVQEELRHQILGYNYCIDEILGDDYEQCS